MSANVQSVASPKAKSARDPRSAKPGLKDQALFFVGFFGAFMGIGTDLPMPVIFLWLFVFVTAAMVRQMPYAFEKMAVDSETFGPPACPRCDHYQRSPSGWCEPCVAQLSADGGVRNATLEQLVIAERDGDLDAACALLADKTTITGPSGVRVRGKAERAVRRLHKGGLLAKSQTQTFITGCGDPADPAIAWASVRTTVDWKFTKPPLDIQTVLRLTIDHEGRISEAKSFRGRFW